MKTVQAINHSSRFSIEEIDQISRALSIQATHHIAPAWELIGASVQQRERRPEDWQLIFLEHSDQANALGYHEDQVDGLPIMKVFVQDCEEAGVSPSSCASHELAEAMVDPDLIRLTLDESKGRAWFCEVGDPAQAFTYDIGGIEVQDFVTPAWFNPSPPAGAKFSHTGEIHKAFEVPPGGYAQYSTDLRNWKDIGFELGAGHTRPERRRQTLKEEPS
jgi:hypothetical protein